MQKYDDEIIVIFLKNQLPESDANYIHTQAACVTKCIKT